MNKILRYVLLAVMVSCGAMSTKAENPSDIQQFIELCSYEKGLETVFVNKELLKMANNFDLNRMVGNNLLYKIETIGIVEADSKKEVSKLEAITSLAFKSEGKEALYSVVMALNEDGNQTKILELNRKWNGKNVYVIQTKESNEMTVVVIYGSLTLADVSKLKL